MWLKNQKRKQVFDHYIWSSITSILVQSVEPSDLIQLILLYKYTKQRHVIKTDKKIQFTFVFSSLSAPFLFVQKSTNKFHFTLPLIVSFDLKPFLLRVKSVYTFETEWRYNVVMHLHYLLAYIFLYLKERYLDQKWFSHVFCSDWNICYDTGWSGKFALRVLFVFFLSDSKFEK